MKVYPITNNAIETIEWNHGGESFALVYIFKSSRGDTYRTIVLNLIEAEELHAAIEDSLEDFFSERRRK